MSSVVSSLVLNKVITFRRKRKRPLETCCSISISLSILCEIFRRCCLVSVSTKFFVALLTRWSTCHLRGWLERMLESVWFSSTSVFLSLLFHEDIKSRSGSPTALHSFLALYSNWFKSTIWFWIWEKWLRICRATSLSTAKSGLPCINWRASRKYWTPSSVLELAR